MEPVLNFPEIPKHLLNNPEVQAQLNNLLIDPETCQSIKSRKEPYYQCSKAKKENDLCGIHLRANKVIRIDQLAASIKKPEPIKPPSPIIKEYQYPELVNLAQENLNPLRLQISLKRHGLCDSEKPPDLAVQVEKLKAFLKPAYEKALAASLGPAKISECQNDTDFYQLDKLEEIPEHFYFSFSETESQRNYGCDFRSFQQYITNLQQTQSETDSNPIQSNDESTPAWLRKLVITNPYNRQLLKPETAVNYHRKLMFLKRYHPQEALSFPEPELTPEEKLRFKVLDVFQIIYHYDYPVDHLWFLNLTKDKLIKYYGRLEDIWNFRLGLSKRDKKLIVPNNPNLFNKQELKLLKHQNLYTIQNRMINHLEALVTQGQSLADRKNGAMYLLIGMVEICPQAAQNLPFLAYSAGIAV